MPCDVVNSRVAGRRGDLAGALAEKIRKDHEKLPMPTLVFSGADMASERTRIEAFVDQVKNVAKKRYDVLHAGRA